MATKMYIKYSEKNLNTTLDEYIYISLTDHIYFALKRYKENLPIKNELLYELRRIHKKEYEIVPEKYKNKVFQAELPKEFLKILGGLGIDKNFLE